MQCVDIWSSTDALVGSSGAFELSATYHNVTCNCLSALCMSVASWLAMHPCMYLPVNEYAWSCQAVYILQYTLVHLVANCLQQFGSSLHEGVGGCRRQDGPEDEAFQCTGEHSHLIYLCLLRWPCLAQWICILPVFNDPQDSAGGEQQPRLVLQPACSPI